MEARSWTREWLAEHRATAAAEQELQHVVAMEGGRRRQAIRKVQVTWRRWQVRQRLELGRQLKEAEARLVRLNEPLTRLVVAECMEVDAGTQTESRNAGVSAGTQTEGEDTLLVGGKRMLRRRAGGKGWARVATTDGAAQTEVAVMEAEAQTHSGARVDVAAQTDSICEAGQLPFETVVGRQLHPAQARALARAEEAAARIERVQEEVEARAARYAVQPAQTGGRQQRKESVRRRAAAAGLDVAGWMEVRRQERSVATMNLIERRLESGRERWLQQQRGGYVGGEVAQRTFLQAAQAAGIEARPGGGMAD